MNNYDATDPDTAFVLCAVCDKGITGGRWSARIGHEGITIALCCPLCTDTFNKKPIAYVKRILTYEKFAENQRNRSA